jgi:hypothetical protein
MVDILCSSLQLLDKVLIGSVTADYLGVAETSQHPVMHPGHALGLPGGELEYTLQGGLKFTGCSLPPPLPGRTNGWDNGVALCTACVAEPRETSTADNQRPAILFHTQANCTLSDIEAHSAVAG